jgi:hypothetical protein
MNNLKSKFAIFSLSAICLLFSALTVSAQVVDTPEGTVEFIGLEEWTVEKIKAVMAEKAPNQPLGMCAAVLVEKVGFASASAKGIGKVNGKDYTVVTLVEPQKAQLLKEKPEPENSLPNDEKWRQGIELRAKNRQAFHIGLDFYSAFLKSDNVKVNKLLSDLPQFAEHFKTLWQFLKMQNTPADFDKAIWTLNNDGNWRNRLFAAAVLANFADKDLTWWTLMDAQRDSFHAVATTASQVLFSLLDHNPRKINWAPAVHSVRYMVNGTNVFLFTKALQALTKTNINPELRKILLKENSQLLLAHLGANYKPDAEVARNFLKHLSGKDFGFEVDKWDRWIKEV